MEGRSKRRGSRVCKSRRKKKGYDWEIQFMERGRRKWKVERKDRESEKRMLLVVVVVVVKVKLGTEERE